MNVLKWEEGNKLSYANIIWSYKNHDVFLKVFNIRYTE